jgi:CheY-like chemotaxis protein
MSEREKLVLVAEDDDTLRFLMLKQLIKMGVQAHCVKNGAEAVERAKAVSYSAIFMDLKMPVMDGSEAIRQIRAIEAEQHKPHAPIIVMTAYGDRERCAELSINDFLFKPVLFDALKQSLNRCSITGDDSGV